MDKAEFRKLLKEIVSEYVEDVDQRRDRKETPITFMGFLAWLKWS